MNSEPYNGLPGDHLLRLERRFWSFQRRAVAPRPDLGSRGACDWTCLRTHCRVVRVLTDSSGHASGVEYMDANGSRQVQEALR